jgi:hypothetical protein
LASLLSAALAIALAAAGHTYFEKPRMSPDERDLLIRTVIGEANSQGDTGQKAVAATVLNRVKAGGYGNGVGGVVLKPRQFEPWTTRRAELLRYTQDDPAYVRAAGNVDAAINGDDPTGGATHFANVDTVRARGNSRALKWLGGMSNPVKIGAHTFGRADGEGRDGDAGPRELPDDGAPPPPARSRPRGRPAQGGFDLAEAMGKPGADNDNDGAEAESTPGARGDSADDDNFSLATVMQAINEPARDEEHAAIKARMASLLADYAPANTAPDEPGHAVALGVAA